MKLGPAREGWVLAADVGGTKTLLALAPLHGKAPAATRTVASHDWPDFESLARDFLAGEGQAELAAIAIAGAGPVEHDAIALTHLPWRIEATRIAAALHAPRVALLNDLVASALGMHALPAAAFATLQVGTRRPRAPIAVLAAGTGLGVALLGFDGERPFALPSEAGNAGFAPHRTLATALHAHLAGRDGAHVPLEDVVSGPGLVRIHDFLRARSAPSASHAAAAADADRPAAISAAALRGEDPLCVAALDLFVRCYGSAAGDLALQTFASGGIWLGGGIAPKILPALQSGAFLEAFHAKGRFEDWLTTLPVAVCTREDTALLGAVAEARRIAG